jgi:hypothetical protein
MSCPDCARTSVFMEHTLAKLRAGLDAILIESVMRPDAAADSPARELPIMDDAEAAD